MIYISFFLSGSEDGIARVWDIESNKQYVLDGHLDAIKYISVTNSLKHIITWAKDKTLRIWDIEEKKQKASIEKEYFSDIIDAALTKNNKYLVISSFEMNYRVWKICSD